MFFIKNLSFTRLGAMIAKEFIQLKRDRLTFAMIIGIPIMQLVLFGFAINNNPKYLPTALITAENTVFSRAFTRRLENTEYFRIVPNIKTEQEAERLLALSKLQFIINIPQNFQQKLIRGENPQILIEADATDPVATAGAFAAAKALPESVFQPILTGTLGNLSPKPFPIDLIVHAKYNPENITQYNIIPGLLGVVLTMTLVIVSSIGITKEVEHGTMENLLSTPIRPLEVMIGKIIPYLFIGYVQVFLILIAAQILFHIPVQGSIPLLLFVTFPFIAANLSMGITFSSLAKNQLQASQMAVFFFLPSMLLSGFMFPFYGMPVWAQYIGNILPLTHFLRIVRGIILKGNDLALVLPNLWPIIVFMIVALCIGLKRYRRTLD